LATAVALRDGLQPLEVRCYHEWKGIPLSKCARISSDPEIRELLGYGKRPVMRQWMRHDWERLKGWLRRIIHTVASKLMPHAP
jgi:hypothetical protein